MLTGHSFSIEGDGGSGYSASLVTPGWATSLVYLGDGLLVTGVAHDSIWNQKFSLSGEHLWERAVKPCGSAKLKNVSAVRAHDRLWGIVGVDDGSVLGRSFLMQLDLEGQLLGVYRVSGVTEDAQLHHIASNGEAVVVSAFDHDTPDGYVSAVARLQ